jgi:hypothetical protein
MSFQMSNHMRPPYPLSGQDPPVGVWGGNSRSSNSLTTT